MIDYGDHPYGALSFPEPGWAGSVAPSAGSQCSILPEIVGPVQAVQTENPSGRFREITQNHQYKTDYQYMQDPVKFFSINDIPGICLEDMLKGKFEGLVDANVQVMEAAPGDKVSYAFEWPTKSTPVKKQMNAHRKNGVQSRGRVAQQVARMVGKFIHEQADHIPLDPSWHVGPGFIELKHVYLVELKRVSKATWVAKLAVCLD